MLYPAAYCLIIATAGIALIRGLSADPLLGLLGLNCVLQTDDQCNSRASV